jgi:hypothetical protein
MLLIVLFHLFEPRRRDMKEFYPLDEVTPPAAEPKIKRVGDQVSGKNDQKGRDGTQDAERYEESRHERDDGALERRDGEDERVLILYEEPKKLP